MRAVVLVGGFGTRLRPLTDVTPKQMLPIVNRPMIERVLEHLHRHGVGEAVLSLGYRPDAFSAAYPDDRCAGVKLCYAVEDEPLDTAGAIRFAAEEAGLDRETVLVANGDILTDLDIGALVEFHEHSGAEGTIALHRVNDPSAYGVVPTDADGQVLAFVEKPSREDAPSDRINAGTYVLEPELLRRIPRGRPVSIERETFPDVVTDGGLFALADESYWIDAGTPLTYLRAQLDLLDGVRGPPENGLAPDAKVSSEAIVERTVLGPACEIGAGARVRGSVLLAGARVEERAQVDDSILGAGATVHRGGAITACTVLGDGAVVDCGERLVASRRAS
jgi:mannose-1-phosphate guanylyltransferase